MRCAFGTWQAGRRSGMHDLILVWSIKKRMGSGIGDQRHVFSVYLQLPIFRTPTTQIVAIVVALLLKVFQHSFEMKKKTKTKTNYNLVGKVINDKTTVTLDRPLTTDR